MTILVTGGTGLVGSRLLRGFVDAGVNCRALVRPGKEVLAGTPVEGDLLNVDSLKPAVEDVSAIVHLAAVFRTQNADDIFNERFAATPRYRHAGDPCCRHRSAPWLSET